MTAREAWATRTTIERSHGLPASHLRWLLATYGEKLRARRWIDIVEARLSGKTQAEIAAHLHLSRSFVGAMEGWCVRRLVDHARADAANNDVYRHARPAAKFIKGECPTCHGDGVLFGGTEGEVACSGCRGWMEFTR